MPGNGTCTTAEEVPVTVGFTSSSGRPASVDGALTIAVLSGDGSFTQDAAVPLVFVAVSGETATDTVYNVSADADLGSGVTTISDTFTLSVTSEQAAAFGFSVGAAQPKA